MLKIMQDDLKFMQDNREQEIGHHGFQDTEVAKMARAVDYVTQNLNNDKTNEMKQFYNFFTSYDIRRNKNFVETFPQFSHFYEECREVANG